MDSTEYLFSVHYVGILRHLREQVVDDTLSPRKQRERRGSATTEMTLVHAKCRKKYADQHPTSDLSFNLMTSTR